jgi:apolipoprotein D and lipocalin family protein
MFRVTALALPVALAALTACAPPAPRAVFRDAAAPIWSVAAFDPAMLAGDWRQVAAFAGEGAPACSGGALRFAPGGASASGALCLGGVRRPVAGAVRVLGPGRVQVAGQPAPWWVLWRDGDGRTLVLGTPDGTFGAVLDRGTISPDRLAAVRAVLAWNGYDLGRLRP